MRSARPAPMTRRTARPRLIILPRTIIPSPVRKRKRPGVSTRPFLSNYLLILSGSFSSFCFGGNASLVGCALGVHVALNELDDGERSVVALTEAGLHDAKVAAVAGCVTRSDRVEQLANCVL